MNVLIILYKIKVLFMRIKKTKTVDIMKRVYNNNLSTVEGCGHLNKMCRYVTLAISVCKVGIKIKMQSLVNWTMIHR